MTFRAIIGDLEVALALLDESTLDGIDGQTLEAATEYLIRLQEAKRVLADVTRRFEQLVVSLMPQRVVQLDGVGTLERHGGRDYRGWDHARLISLLAARAADRRVDRDTGEILPPAVFAQAVADLIAKCAAIYKWKVTGLREEGIDPEQFCEVVEKDPTVSISRAKS